MSISFIDKLNLPNKFDLPEYLTFGIEIEFENAKFSSVRSSLEELKTIGAINPNWQLKVELSLEVFEESSLGGEIVSPVLFDSEKAYEEIETICKMIIDMGGKITTRCGGHIHIGANVYKENLLYYGRLMRLWTIFEKEIVKFGFGEFDHARDTMEIYAYLPAPLFQHIDEFERGDFGKVDFDNFLKNFGFEKKLAISFYYLDKEQPINTIELRCPNGTLDYRVWKNNIYFFSKLILSCLDETKDWSLIEKMFQEEKTVSFEDYFYGTDSLDKAKFLANFIYGNELDIENFLLQYKKGSFKRLVR